MPQTHSITLPLRAPVGVFARTLVAVSAALTRRRDRLRLAHLDPHLLRDIGLDAQAARRECAKPFWQP
ncbi:MAG: DUF1127 domain-containing protein [Acetobacteraceae bacterium]|nr:MAG: DUF1127 domain-containing protein [Acetobacteraceae bacterium]